MLLFNWPFEMDRGVVRTEKENDNGVLQPLKTQSCRASGWGKAITNSGHALLAFKAYMLESAGKHGALKAHCWMEKVYTLPSGYVPS